MDSHSHMHASHGSISRTSDDVFPTTPSHAGRSREDTLTSPSHVPRGEPRAFSDYFLAKGFACNSYFAQPLRHAMYLILLLAIAGVSSFWASMKSLEDGGLYVSDVKTSIAFKTYQCGDGDSSSSGSCSSCRMLVVYAMIEYHILPVTVLIGLPATGWRVFEPFKREHKSVSREKWKVTRSGYLQFCEVLCTCIIVLHLVVLVFFAYSIFTGRLFECKLVRVQLYAIGGFLAYIAVMVEITYFARFREHIKMQLGAFQESDQTSYTRTRLKYKKTCLWLERKRIISEIRKGLYKETKLGNVDNIKSILSFAQTHLGDNFVHYMYSSARIFCIWFGIAKKNPLHAAAHHGNLQALDLLVRAGIDVNSLDKVNRIRFSTGDIFSYCVQYMISRSIYAVNDEMSESILETTLVTPLHCAVLTGQIGAVRWLLDHGADPNLKAKSSDRTKRVSPLFVAESPEIVTLLLEAGANLLEVPDPRRMNTLTALQAAYMRGNVPVASVLERAGCDVALTPLHEAAAANDIAKVQRLLSRGADPNCVGENGYCGLSRRTPLHWGAVTGAVEAVERLLAAGADPNFQDNRGRTPLHWAAAVNRPAVVKVLLENSADPRIRDWNDMTPLLCASSAKNVPKALFEYLLRHGANVNERLWNGDTGLHLAMKCEQQQTALALLAVGGDIMRTNDEGLRPVDCTTSTTLQFEIKRAAGNRDVMISYTHSHAEFAKKLRQSLEDANITSWLDLMDPSGIGGGSVWREEIARGIKNAAMVVCILTEDYTRSGWCLKELALAKQSGTPIMAISTEGVAVTEDLQVYLYTRQMVPFEPAITMIHNENPRSITYEYDEERYSAQFRLLLDGIRDEIEKQRKAHMAHRRRQYMATASIVGGSGVLGWDLATLYDSDFVFIAHGEQHHRFAHRIFEQLSDNGVRCLLDGAQAYEDLSDHIAGTKEAILRCASFVVVISSKTMASEVVKDQLAFAEDKGKPIVPILLNETEIGLDTHYTLSRGELFHFAPELGFSASFTRLLEHVREVVPRVFAPSSDARIDKASTGGDRRRVGLLGSRRASKFVSLHRST